MASIQAHNITYDDDTNTILGFYKDFKNIYYVDSNYRVVHLFTGEVVAEDAATYDKASRVTAKDIMTGSDMTISCSDQTITPHIGITITQFTLNNNESFKSINLLKEVAVQLMHKWFIEHKMLDLFKQIAPHLTEIEAFEDWIKYNIPHLNPVSKDRWLLNTKLLKDHMEKKNCSFHECNLLSRSM